VDLEQAIVREIKEGKAVPLEKALLVLSGLKTDQEIQCYHHKVDDIFDRFLKKWGNRISSDPPRPPAYLVRPIAECLFEYLWTSKPKRFGQFFLLTDVINAQLNPDVHQSVGTCVGLTSLYSVLGLRAGLSLTLLVVSGHLLSRLRVGQQSIDIDHTDPQGFDCRKREDFREFPLLTLTANVINSRGLMHESRGQMAAAKGDYQKALLVNPEYANAWNNRGNMKFRDGDVEGAVSDYNEAIRLNPRFSEAYCNRGMVRQRLGHYEAARRDYHMATSIIPESNDARECLQTMDKWGCPPPASLAEGEQTR
jgi:tetratricopeptide (TPR) repeat protein